MLLTVQRAGAECSWLRGEIAKFLFRRCRRIAGGPGPGACVRGEGAGKLVRVLVSRLEEAVSVLDIHYVFASPGHVTTADEQHHLGLFTKDQYVAAAETSGLTVEWNPDGLIGRSMLIGVKSPKDG